MENPLLGYYGSEVDELTIDGGKLGYCTGLVPCEFYGEVFRVNGGLWDCFVPVDNKHNMLIMEVYNES